jgi:hypothetical protein
MSKTLITTRRQWLTILSTQEAVIRRIVVRSQTRQIPNTKIELVEWLKL